MTISPFNNVCLFIGGKNDGSAIAVPLEIHSLRRRVPFDKSEEYETYKVKILEGTNMRWRIFVHEDLSINDAIEMLLNKYNSKL